MLNVENLQLLGSGTIKNVYQHPQDADKIIKTIKPQLVAADGGFAKHSAFKRAVYQGIYRQFRREILQYLQLCKTHYSSGIFQFPIETPYGLVATSEGLGLVVEKILGPDGRAWTLEDLSKGPGLESKHQKALDRFFDDCVQKHIVFGEVNDAGLLYTEQRSGYPEFVLVDGIGEKLMLPVRAMFSTISARYVRKTQRRIQGQLEALSKHESKQLET
ncbi:YrbL family protein [Comamonas sp.]|uniref:YrbL family protein n=1 Tax=Comamonas sp. TaxID=34028 RepID=UPI00258646C4|nr:YrbL family protein [Comamonas sp.]